MENTVLQVVDVGTDEVCGRCGSEISLTVLEGEGGTVVGCGCSEALTAA